MSDAEDDETSLKDTFNILVATDNHLGFTDNNNPDRENDGFNTFEEILTIAKEQNVDFVLLGGDLFHENKPKPAVFHRAVDVLQRHCLGSKPVEFEYLGDPAVDFHGQLEPEVNYLNPNINIGLPIFTIHGNHDDPIGLKKTSCIDHLAAANLLNHFGQWDTLTEFSIRPLLFRKGTTQLAIYGLGHLKDERLYRLMRDNKVSFLRPEEDDGSQWFNIFVLHQNRAKRGPTNYFPDSYIPEFIDLVVWGHEHDCRLDPELSGGSRNQPTYIIQPGSSVATSLAKGESIDKHVFHIQIKNRKFKPTRIKLQSVRPFCFDEIHTAEIDIKKKVKEPAKSIETYVQARVKALIAESNGKLTGHPKQPLEPLIRIVVHYDNDNEQFNALRFSQQFMKEVANENIVLFHRTSTKIEDGGDMDIGAIQEMIMQTENESLEDLGAHVEEIVEKHFAHERLKDGQVMEILSERGLSEAVRTCVEKNDKDVLKVIIEAQIKKSMDHLINRKATTDSFEEELKAFMEARYAQGHEEDEIIEVREVLKGMKTKTTKKNNNTGMSTDEDDVAIDDDEDEDGGSSSRKPAGRGRGSRGGGRGARGGGRGRASKAKSNDSSFDSPARGRGSRGAKAVKAAPVQQKLPVRRAQATSSKIQFDDSSASD